MRESIEPIERRDADVDGRLRGRIVCDDCDMACIKQRIQVRDKQHTFACKITTNKSLLATF